MSFCASVSQIIFADIDGRLDATFMIAPLAMKMREQGVKVKIAYLGHRDGSTVMVRKDLPAKTLADLYRANIRALEMAIPTNLAESELFGHARGAFTGADGASLGLLSWKIARPSCRSSKVPDTPSRSPQPGPRPSK